MLLITIIYVFVRINKVEYNLIDLSQLFDEYGVLSHEQYVLLCKNKQSGIYEIRISTNTDKMAPNFDKLIGIIDETKMNCLRAIFINQKTIMVCCVFIDNQNQQNYMNYIFDLLNEGVITQFQQEVKSQQEQITQILLKPITFANLKQKYLIRGIPSQGNTNLIDNTILEIFTFDENYILQPTTYEINSQLLRQLMQNMHFIFRLVDFKVIPQGCFYLLDAVYGVIILKLSEQGFSLKNYYDFQSISKYYSMDLYVNPGNSNDVQVIVSAENNQVIYFIADQLSSIWYIQPIHNVSDYQTSIYFSNSQYLIIKNATQIVLYNYQRYSQWLYQMSIPSNSLVSFSNYFPEFLYLDNQKSQKYTLCSGMLILDPHSSPIDRTEFLLVATSSTTQCIVKIIFKLFPYLDNSLYAKENVDDQLYSIISYPKLPQASIFKQTAVTGSNINILAQITNSAPFVDFQIGYYKDLQIVGIDWPEQLGYLTILPLQQMQKVLYLVQDIKEMKAIFYSCQFTYFDSYLNCIRFHEITPNRILDCNSFQWYLVSEFPIMQIVFGYISKFAHTVEVYLYKDQELFNLFQISTSLMDEDSRITALTITRQLVYIIMRAKPKIDVYEYMLDGQFELQYFIDKQILNTEGYNGEFDPISIIQNENTAKIIILNQQSIIIGYQLYKFFLITFQSYPDSRSLNLAIGKRTFYIVIIYDDKQELIEYDYMTIRQVIFRRKIPLFHYLIQTPIQMASIPNQDIIILRAYTPVLQQTVILIFQADSLTREALTVTIPLGYYTKDTLILGFGGNDLNAMFFHMSTKQGIKNIYVHQEIQAILNPKLEWEDIYVHHSKVLIQYNSIDSPEKIQFIQEVTFLNLQSTISLAAPKEFIAQIEDRDMSEFIIIENDWFQGWISNYEINCFQCSEQITLTQKIDPLYNFDYPTNIISYCNYEKDTTILLGIETLYFVDSQQNIVRQQQNFKMDGTYVISNIYCSSQYPNIFLTGRTEMQKPFIQLLRCSETECKVIGKPSLNQKYDILQLQIIGNNILVLDNYEEFIYQSSQFCTIRVLVTNLFVDYITAVCIQSRNVDNNFYSNSFVVSTVRINQVQIYRVILNDGQNGLYWIDYTEDNSEFNFLQPMFNPVQLSLNQLILEKLNIKLDGSPCFYTVTMIQDQIFNLDEGTNSIKLLLLSIDKAQIGLLVTFKGQQFLSIQIEYLLQRYANWEIRKKVSSYGGFVAISYNKLYNYQDYSICIYKLPNLIDNHLIEHPILTIGCISSNVGTTGNYFFYLNSNMEQYLQLLFRQNNNLLVLSKIYNQAVINIIDARKVVEQPITVIATNYLTKSERMIILQKVAVDPREIFEIIVSILGGVLLVLLLIVLWIVIWKKHKSRQKVTVLMNSGINFNE